MSNTITLTEEQMKALQLGKSITIEPPKPAITKWEPKRGKFILQSDLDGSYSAPGCSVPYILAGLTYATEAKANSAAKALRAYARQLAWLAENDDGWIADWDDHYQNKYFIIYSNETSKFQKSKMYQANPISMIFMSEQNAAKLARFMNEGIVEF